MIFTRYRRGDSWLTHSLTVLLPSESESVSQSLETPESRVRTVCHTVDQGNLFSAISTWIYLRLAADRRHWSIEKGPLMDNYARSWPCVKKGEYTVLYSMIK